MSGRPLISGAELDPWVNVGSSVPFTVKLYSPPARSG